MVRGSDQDYVDRHPGPADVVMVVEVSDSSLRRDQVFKKPIYAKAGIPVYWIVNLIDRRVEVYTDPTGPAAEPDYRVRHDVGEADFAHVVIEGRDGARLPSLRCCLGRLLSDTDPGLLIRAYLCHPRFITSYG